MSANTPENKEKKLIRAWLNGFGAAVSYITPVPGPFGKTKSDPDFIFSFCGIFVAIEAKARGKSPTKLQLDKHKELRASGALVFVVDNAKVQLPEIERAIKHRARLYRQAVLEFNNVNSQLHQSSDGGGPAGQERAGSAEAGSGGQVRSGEGRQELEVRSRSGEPADGRAGRRSAPRQRADGAALGA